MKRPEDYDDTVDYDHTAGGENRMAGDVNQREEAVPRTENCAQFRPYLHRLIEDELTPMTSALVRSHLENCPQCERFRQELEDERLLVLESLVSMPELSAKFAGKVRQKIEGEIQWARAQTRQRWVLGLGSAAAMILVAVVLAIGSSNRSEAPLVAATVPTVISPPADLSRPHALPVGASIVRPVSLPVGLRAPARHQRQQSFIFHGPNGAKTKITPPAGARLTKVFRFRVRTNPGHPNLNVGHVLALANRLGQRPILRRRAPQDPCRDDPNDDGITDLKDLAYACQVVMGTGQALTGSMESKGRNLRRGDPNAVNGTPTDGSLPDGTFTDSECEEYCLRV